MWCFGPPNQIRFDAHGRYIFSLQRSATFIPHLHLVCHDDLSKVAHSVNYDSRRKPSWLFKLRGYLLLIGLSSQNDKKNQNASF
jgi:hypothetical protein